MISNHFVILKLNFRLQNSSKNDPRTLLKMQFYPFYWANLCKISKNETFFLMILIHCVPLKFDLRSQNSSKIVSSTLLEMPILPLLNGTIFKGLYSLLLYNKVVQPLFVRIGVGRWCYCILAARNKLCGCCRGISVPIFMSLQRAK